MLWATGDDAVLGWKSGPGDKGQQNLVALM